MSLLRIYLYGQFRLVSQDGTDLTPRSEKARALVALLATAHAGERRRAWLQDKLWSDAPPDRGSQSLRQALSDVRKALGDLASLVEADRRRVRLANFRVADAEPGHVFLDTLEIADPEFNDWLRGMRQGQDEAIAADAPASHAPPEAAPRAERDWVIVTGGKADTDPAVEFMRKSLMERICRSVGEQVPIHVTEQMTDGATLSLEVESFSTGQTTTYRIAWRQCRSGYSLWSVTRMIGSEGQPAARHIDTLKLANDAAKGLFEVRRQLLLRKRELAQPDMLIREAVALMFSMRPGEFGKADQLLLEAHERSPRGLCLAWRALLRMVQVIERHEIDAEVVREEAMAMARYALEREPHNSTVQAVAANVFLMFARAGDAALDLARSAVSQNSANPLAWDALGLVAIHHGDREKSHEHALTAQRIGGSGIIKHWLDMACCLTSVMTRDLDLALAFARSSHTLSPDFRPPLRYQLALCAQKGAWQDAEKARNALISLEPDFSIEKMMEDETYPLAAYRASGLSLSRLSYLA